LGLTATLVREDGKISDLSFLIGPKLYEANWLSLQSQGYIAKCQCVEVWCPMTAEFYREYLTSRENKGLLYMANPNKMLAMQYLIDLHKRRGDKIIIFSDNLFLINQFSEILRIPKIYGKTSARDRSDLLNLFKSSDEVNAIFVSKVADDSFDIPGANVVIQISSHYKSRKQEAQRLGRILRPKENVHTGEFNAFFYTLLSKDTKEMEYAIQRQRFLVDQGYAYKVVNNLPFMNDKTRREKMALGRKKEQIAFLERVLANDDQEKPEEGPKDDFSSGDFTVNMNMGSHSFL